MSDLLEKQELTDLLAWRREQAYEARRGAEVRRALAGIEHELAAGERPVRTVNGRGTRRMLYFLYLLCAVGFALVIVEAWVKWR